MLLLKAPKSQQNLRVMYVKGELCNLALSYCNNSYTVKLGTFLSVSVVFDGSVRTGYGRLSTQSQSFRIHSHHNIL